MTALTLSTAAAPGLRADAIVIGVAKGAKGTRRRAGRRGRGQGVRRQPGGVLRPSAPRARRAS
ncbi:Exonuclease SbcC [Streptomyces murinus]